MKFYIKASGLTNVVIIIISLFISVFSFLFGIANFIYPEVSDEFLFQNTVVCIVLCCIGLVFFLLAIASLRGIQYKSKIKKK